MAIYIYVLWLINGFLLVIIMEVVNLCFLNKDDKNVQNLCLCENYVCFC